MAGHCLWPTKWLESLGSGGYEWGNVQHEPVGQTIHQSDACWI